ncbi:N-acetyltransferase [Bacillus sp. AFS017336]|uniref:GNAT family N-acetyltransferase n=1 Tax=Bacillus sp. AFS017336 TaxID=2033489 RepID=UPI000BF1B30C|nr:GNAT family N-acetyltransferase [Bacillus sp. AFS017336]PEK99059.1 GNAT family N-acetyltransferase [Bacillus sp. AFS017336]
MKKQLICKGWSNLTLNLTQMNKQDFQRFLDLATVNFAKDKVKNGSWKEETALDQSKAAFQSLLPEGEKTENNYLKNIVLNEQFIGYIWYSINLKQEPNYAYLFEILIYPEYRGQGYGNEAMSACIKEINELGIEDVCLHVFGHNQGALKLYQKLGFEITDYNLKVSSARFK